MKNRIDMDQSLGLSIISLFISHITCLYRLQIVKLRNEYEKMNTK